MTTTSGSEVLTTRRLNRATLARQLLLERVRMDVRDAVEHLVGLQAQAPKPPYYALAARLDGFETAALERLLTERQAVRIVSMRSTVHLLTAVDALTLVPLSRTPMERELTGFRKSLDGVDLDRLTALAEELCREPVSYRELGDALQKEWPEHERLPLKVAARIRLPLVQVPPRGLWDRGGQVVLTTVQSWLGREPEAEPDADAVVLRYLAAFGPASVKDMQTWCGVTRMRGPFDRLRPRLRTFRDEQGTELFDLPDAPRPDAETPAPPRFLGEFDNLLLSHADRTRVISEAHRPRTYRRDHAFGSFLVDGFVRGLWRVERAKENAVMRLETFAPLSRDELTAVEEEAHGVLAMTAPGAAHGLTVTEAP